MNITLKGGWNLLVHGKLQLFWTSRMQMRYWRMSPKCVNILEWWSLMIQFWSCWVSYDLQHYGEGGGDLQTIPLKWVTLISLDAMWACVHMHYGLNMICQFYFLWTLDTLNEVEHDFYVVASFQWVIVTFLKPFLSVILTFHWGSSSKWSLASPTKSFNFTWNNFFLCF